MTLDLPQLNRTLDAWFAKHHEGKCGPECMFCEELITGGVDYRREYQRIQVLKGNKRCPGPYAIQNPTPGTQPSQANRKSRKPKRRRSTH